MKAEEFVIDRASDLFGKPCEEAYKDVNEWIVEFETLADLMEFVEKYGELIIYPASGGLPEITIYDDYME